MRGFTCLGNHGHDIVWSLNGLSLTGGNKTKEIHSSLKLLRLERSQRNIGGWGGGRWLLNVLCKILWA